MRKKKHLCEVKYCRNSKSTKDRICSKHRKRLHREKDFVAYTFNLLKSNAKRRGKFFDLTLEEFKTFCINTGYMEGKGKKATSLSIDRKDVSKGYTIDNLQILTLSANTVKRHEEDYPF